MTSIINKIFTYWHFRKLIPTAGRDGCSIVCNMQRSRLGKNPREIENWLINIERVVECYITNFPKNLNLRDDLGLICIF